MFQPIIRKARPRTRLKLEVLESRDCPAAYSIVDLLPPSGGNGSDAAGLNDNGFVVGTSRQVSGYEAAAAWQAGVGTTAAGTFLPLFGQDNFSEAHDANNVRTIAGTSGVVSGPTHAVVWTSAGNSWTIHDLGTLPGTPTLTFTTSFATSVSEPDAAGATWIVGGSSGGSGETDVMHPAIWRIDGAGSILATIDLEPSGSTRAWANDVRIVGESVFVAGIAYTSASDAVARTWTLDLAGNVVSRTDLGTFGGPTSAGVAINSLGHVVGDAQSSAGTIFGFIQRDGVMTNLGSLGNDGSWALGLNDSDTVVGAYWTKDRKSTTLSPSRPQAYVWQNGTMRDLRGQLTVPDRSNWGTLFVGVDVNAAGQIAGAGSIKVGKGRYEQHAFLMTPPALHADTAVAGSSAAGLTLDQAQPLLAEALARWQSAGIDTSGLQDVDVRIADLGGTTLGLASGNTIWLDDNAAGWGWFIDPTPGDDFEFTTPGDQDELRRMDLLSVLAHEIGHLLGHDHEQDGVMQENLSTAERLTLDGGSEADWLTAVDLVFSGTSWKKRK